MGIFVNAQVIKKRLIVVRMKGFYLRLERLELIDKDGVPGLQV